MFWEQSFYPFIVLTVVSLGLYYFGRTNGAEYYSIVTVKILLSQHFLLVVYPDETREQSLIVFNEQMQLAIFSTALCSVVAGFGSRAGIICIEGLGRELGSSQRGSGQSRGGAMTQKTDMRAHSAELTKAHSLHPCPPTFLQLQSQSTNVTDRQTDNLSWQYRVAHYITHRAVKMAIFDDTSIGL